MFTDFHTFFEASFAQFDSKILNRELEFKHLAPYIKSLPKTIDVFTFPHTYAYEKEIISKFGKRIRAWSAEKISQGDPTSTTVQAKRFIKDYPNCEVYLPCTYKGNFLMPLHRNNIDIFSILDGSIPMGKVDLSKYSVVQQPYECSQFDIADADHVSSYNLLRSAENNAIYDNVKKGGLFLTTFAVAATRDITLTHKMYSDVLEPEEEENFSREQLTKEPKKRYYSPSREQLIKFGLGNAADTEMYISIVNNVAYKHSEFFKNEPVYINMYRGGISAQGKVMMRIAWVKK